MLFSGFGSGDGGVDFFGVLRIFKCRIQRKTGGHGNGERADAE